MELFWEQNLFKMGQGNPKMAKEWSKIAFYRFWPVLVRFWTPMWRPSWSHVGDIFGTCHELFEFRRRSLKEVCFQIDFEAILERVGKAKTRLTESTL